MTTAGWATDGIKPSKQPEDNRVFQQAKSWWERTRRELEAPSCPLDTGMRCLGLDARVRCLNLGASKGKQQGDVVCEGWSSAAAKSQLRMWWLKIISLSAVGFIIPWKGWRQNHKTPRLVSGRLVSEMAVAVWKAVLMEPMQTVLLRQKQVGNVRRDQHG